MSEHFNGIVKINNIDIKYDYIELNNSRGTIVAIGGTGGGFYGPSYIYDDISNNLTKMKLSLLRVHVKPPFQLATMQLINAIEILISRNNTKPIVLIGWSMGGASIIHSAKYLINNNKIKVNSIITLAGQSYGADPISELNVPIYIIHGSNDKVMGPHVAKHIWNIAKNPKELVILDGASHFMNEKDKELKKYVYKWILNSFY